MRAKRRIHSFLILIAAIIGFYSTQLSAQLNVQALYEANVLSPDATNEWISTFNQQYESSSELRDFSFLNSFGMGLSYAANGTHLALHLKKRFNRNVADNVVIGEIVDKASLSYSMNSYSGNFDFNLSPAVRFGMEASLHRVIHRFRFDDNRIDNRISDDTWGYGAHLGYYYKSNSQAGFMIQLFGELIDGYDTGLEKLDLNISSSPQDDIFNIGIRLIFTNGQQ